MAKGEQYFIGRESDITIQGKNISMLLGIKDGQVAESMNPMDLVPLTKEQANKLRTRLNTLKPFEVVKYHLKAAGQAIRDYQWMQLVIELPKKGLAEEEVFEAAMRGLNDTTSFEQQVEEVKEAVVEEEVTNDDIDAMIAAAAAKKAEE